MQPSISLLPVPGPTASVPQPKPAAVDQWWSKSLPPKIEVAIWRVTKLGSEVSDVVGTCWEALDPGVPDGDRPCYSMTEELQPQATACEWRLMAPALRLLAAASKTRLVVGATVASHSGKLEWMSGPFRAKA